MKRLLRFAALAFAACALLCSGVWADDTEAGVSEQIDPEEGLAQDVLDRLGSFEGSGAERWQGELLRLLKDALSGASESVRTAMSTGGLILAAVVLCSLLGTSAQGARLTRLVGTLAVTGAAAGGMGSALELAVGTIRQMNEYGMLLLPGLCALNTAAGLGGSGAAVYTAGAAFLTVLLQVSSRLIVPVVLLYTACCAADCAVGEGQLSSLRDFLKWLAVTALKWTSYLFSGYLTISGILAGNADAVKLKTARIAFSGAIPVVGGILADASESILTAALSVRTAAGVYGMLAVLAISLRPFLRIAVLYGAMKASAALSGLFGQKDLTTLIGKLADAFGLLLGLTGTYAAAALLCIALSMKTVGL